MDGDDARRNAASASQESSLCRTYGFDPSGNLSGGQVRIGKGAAETKEAEEAEEAKPKVDRESRASTSPLRFRRGPLFGTKQFCSMSNIIDCFS
jgi:hypothetical protein